MTLVFADPPAPASQPAPAASSATTPVATPVAPAAAASATTTTASVAASAKTALDADEKRLIAEGYKPEMRGGTKVYCKRAQVLGSRLGSPERCGTAEELKATTQMSREVTDRSQRVGTNPTTKLGGSSP